MVGWHHRLNGHEFEQTPGDSEGWGSLACRSPWGHKELDTTERLSSNSGAGAGETPTSASLSSSESPSQTDCGWASHC